MRKKTILIFLFSVLGLFILMIAFFFATSSISKPADIAFYVPTNRTGIDVSKEKHKYTLLLLKQSAYAYENDINAGTKLEYSKVGNFIKNEKEKDSTVAFIIKPVKEATYRSAVDILDQMAINKIRKFNLQEPTKEEENFIAQY